MVGTIKVYFPKENSSPLVATISETKRDIFGPVIEKHPHPLYVADLNMLRKDNWIPRVQKILDRCPVPFNIVIRRFETRQQQGNKIFRENRFSSKLSPKDLIEPEEFEDYENRINVVVIDNFGKNAIPMTPWILFHRVAHALQITKFTSRGFGVEKELENILKFYYAACKLNGQKIEKVVCSHDDGLYEQNAEFAALIGNTKTLRTGHKLNCDPVLLDIDMPAEMFTEYFVTGKMTFNIDAVKEKFVEIKDTNEYKKLVASLWQYKNSLDKFIKSIDNCKGKLIAF